MPRPFRQQWVPRAYGRRRHRTWMLSMTLASLGWACWWAYVLLTHFEPHLNQAFYVASACSSLFSAAGLLAALLAVRARKSWLLFTAVAVFANASLLVLPWIARAQMPP